MHLALISVAWTELSVETPPTLTQPDEALKTSLYTVWQQQVAGDGHTTSQITQEHKTKGRFHICDGPYAHLKHFRKMNWVMIQTR